MQSDSQLLRQGQGSVLNRSQQLGNGWALSEYCPVMEIIQKKYLGAVFWLLTQFPENLRISRVIADPEPQLVTTEPVR